MSRLTYDHPLEAWVDPSRPVDGLSFSWPAVDYIVMHYRGAGKNLVPVDVAAALRRSHLEYLTSPDRGYSLGYNAAVVSQDGHPLDGTAWEIRGDRFRNAANAPKELNARSFSILVMQVDNAPVTPRARARIVRLVAEIDAVTGRQPEIVGHGQAPGVTSGTPCPGGGVRADIDANAYRPSQEEAPMTKLVYLWRHPQYANVWLVGPGGALHMSPELAKRYVGAGVELVTESHAQTLASCLATSGLTTADLVRS